MRKHCVVAWCTRAGLAVALVGLAHITVAQSQTPGARGSTPSKAATHKAPLPLDPVTPEDRKLAEQIAGGDGKIKALFAGASYRLISVELVPLKPEHDEKGAPTRPA